MRVLVTRPQPGAAATAARLRAMGHDAVEAPLLAVGTLAWALPDPLPPAVMLTSAAAARVVAPAGAALAALPCFTVGEATAAAARAAGFADIRSGAGTAQALVGAIAAAGFASVLHLAGSDRVPVVVPTGLEIVTRLLYRARRQPLADFAADCVLLFSPRTAAHFAAECDRLGHARAGIAIAAISQAVALAAGTGWAGIAVAASPDEAALLATLPPACNKIT